MENLYFTVIPAKAGIHWLTELRDPRLRGDDDDLTFTDTLSQGRGNSSSKRERTEWPVKK